MNEVPTERQESEVERSPQDAELDEAHEHAIHAQILPRLLQTIADPGRRPGEFGRDQAQEGERPPPCADR